MPKLVKVEKFWQEKMSKLLFLKMHQFKQKDRRKFEFKVKIVNSALKFNFRILLLVGLEGWVGMFQDPLTLIKTTIIHVFFVCFSVDEERRKNVMNNHSGTHILNFALRQVHFILPLDKTF